MILLINGEGFPEAIAGGTCFTSAPHYLGDDQHCEDNDGSIHSKSNTSLKEDRPGSTALARERPNQHGRPLCNRLAGLRRSALTLHRDDACMPATQREDLPFSTSGDGGALAELESSRFSPQCV